MDSIDRLIQYYNNGTDDIYHQVVANILKNIHQVKSATIYDLADLCYTSPSTISRLVKKLDFENFTDFKSQIHYALKNYRYLNRNTRDINVIEDADIVPLYFNFLINNIMSLKEQCEYGTIAKISDMMYAAGETLFFATPEIPANNLQKALIVTDRPSRLNDPLFLPEDPLRNLKEGDLIFAIIPDLVEMAAMRPVIKNASQAGISVITLCSGEKNPYLKYSDIQLHFEGTKTSMDIYLFTILINLIRYDYTQRYVNDVIDELY